MCWRGDRRHNGRGVDETSRVNTKCSESRNAHSIREHASRRAVIEHRLNVRIRKLRIECAVRAARLQHAELRRIQRGIFAREKRDNDFLKLRAARVQCLREAIRVLIKLRVGASQPIATSARGRNVDGDRVWKECSRAGKTLVQQFRANIAHARVARDDARERAP